MINELQYKKDQQYIEKIDKMLAKRMDHAAYIFALAACLLAHILYVSLFAVAGVKVMVIFNAFSVLFYVLTLVLVKVIKEKVYLIYASFAEIVLHATAATICLGLEPNFSMFLLMIIPLAFLMPNKIKSVPFIVLFVSVSLYGVLNFFYSDSSRVLYDLDATSFDLVFYVINFIIGSAVLIYVAIIFMMMNKYVECRLRVQTEQLKTMASTDPLTKLNNRREMNRRLMEIYDKCCEETSCYIIGIGDVDDFKKVNDTYGHDEGDEVLSTVASLVSKTLPNKGIAARWGGEEFLFVLPDADIDEGRKYADAIINAIKTHKFRSGDKEFSVTMTIGICLGTSSDKVDTVISTADARLYKGKQNGKAHVEFE